jgi:hypothetical protein
VTAPVKLGKKNVTPLVSLGGPWLKVGQERPRPAGKVFGSLPKGEARRLRKALRAAGHRAHAAAARAAGA